DLLDRHFGATCGDIPRRFLQIIARIDQFGKRPVKNIGKGIAKDAVDVLEPYSYGSYGLRRNLKHAVERSESGRPELFGYLQAYDFCRDYAGWLGDGVFPWAREWKPPRRRTADRPTSSPQGNGNSPQQASFRVLFIDETLGLPDEREATEIPAAHDG